MSARFLAISMLITLIAASAIPAEAQATKTWTPPKTPWGDPDIQGQWPATANIPMQRPANMGTRAVLTDEELTQRERQSQTQAAADGEQFRKDTSTADQFRFGNEPCL